MATISVYRCTQERPSVDGANGITDMKILQYWNDFHNNHTIIN